MKEWGNCEALPPFFDNFTFFQFLLHLKVLFPLNFESIHNVFITCIIKKHNVFIFIFPVLSAVYDTIHKFLSQTTGSSVLFALRLLHSVQLPLRSSSFISLLFTWSYPVVNPGVSSVRTHFFFFLHSLTGGIIQPHVFISAALTSSLYPRLIYPSGYFMCLPKYSIGITDLKCPNLCASFTHSITVILVLSHN